MEQKSFCDITLHYEEKDSERYSIDIDCKFTGSDMDKANILTEIYQALEIDANGAEVAICLIAIEALAKRRKQEA